MKSSPIQVPRTWLSICLALALIAGGSRTGATGRSETQSEDTLTIKWYNVSERPLIPESECEVTRAIESKFGVVIELWGGPEVSEGTHRLNRALLSGGALPDVFRWRLNLVPGYPPLERMFAPLTRDLVRTRMPDTYRTIDQQARYAGYSPDAVWRPFQAGGALRAIPRPYPEREYPDVVVWRKDVLDELGFRAPTTVPDWERVFAGYKKAHPDRYAWAGLWGAGVPFMPVFNATGQPLAWYAVRSGRVQLGMLLPEAKLALETLQRWYLKGYIRLVEQNTADFAVDTHELFVRGETIVAADARYADGSWVCDEPLFPGSLEERCRTQNPSARFAISAPPVYDGVQKPYAVSLSAGVFGNDCFGFRLGIEREPEKLQKLMEMIETLAFDKDAFLLSQYGLPGRQYTWRSIDGKLYPERTLTAETAANVGSYWLFPFTSRVEEYGLHPAVAASIDRLMQAPGAPYGRSRARYDWIRIPEPFGEVSEQAQRDTNAYQQLKENLMTRLYVDVLIPIVRGEQSVDALSRFRAYYYENGGEVLEDILTRWYIRGSAK